MKYKELLDQYRRLLLEAAHLRAENERLRTQLGIAQPEPSVTCRQAIEPSTDDSSPVVSSTSDSAAKVDRFMSLFQGRPDVYAKRWERKSDEKSGYSPVCRNLWRTGICQKPKMSCANCAHKAYAPLDKAVVEAHLRGSLVAGIYPMFPDETCALLAVDFDEADWQADIVILRQVCAQWSIPLAVERSRSGAGGHIWFFFEKPIPASLARKFGTALLTTAMNRRPEVPFKSYDRLFPSQDTLPKGGLGNLIALPLQKAARSRHNSEFVDEAFVPYPDQWAFLSTVAKLPESEIDRIVSKLCSGHELGDLKADPEEESDIPWAPRKPDLAKTDFPKQVHIVRANMLFIPKAGFSPKALNCLKRLASFANPMFYRRQAMRLPTYAHPRVISCAENTKEYLCLPRGCDRDLVHLLNEFGIAFTVVDKSYGGKPIRADFKGCLREEQAIALERLAGHDTGILCGTTAFGKTVVAINLIARKQVTTLILVNRVGLLVQWRKRLAEFLHLDDTRPDQIRKKSSKSEESNSSDLVGQLGAGKNELGGIVDVAIMQSLFRKGEVHDCVRHYGMIIADECHHASAFTYEAILKAAPARYIYGLTATPIRKDGHHPILFMHCGPIRYRDNPKAQAAKRPFDHHIVPRFTALQVPFDCDEKDLTIQELYAQIAEDELRNQQIIADVLHNYKAGRNCVVLSLRTAHVDLLARMLGQSVPDVIILKGGLGRKTTQAVLKQIAATPSDKNITLVATGHFIGEGFDEPRLDTLFLAMPISWKGTLQQYAGRLHRLSERKTEVRIYDYVDVRVRMLERMYQKRLSGYAAMGYKVKGDDFGQAPLDIIFDKDNFLPVFSRDLAAARQQIIIVSPFIRKMRTTRMLLHLKTALANNVQIIAVTRPPADFKSEDRDALRELLNALTQTGVQVVLKSNIHQKFAVMDQRIVWYGSINLLSYGKNQESIMRIQSANIAGELAKSLGTINDKSSTVAIRPAKLSVKPRTIAGELEPVSRKRPPLGGPDP